MLICVLFSPQKVSVLAVIDPFRLYFSIYEHSSTHAQYVFPATVHGNVYIGGRGQSDRFGSRKQAMRMRTTVFIDTAIKSERVY